MRVGRSKAVESPVPPSFKTVLEAFVRVGREAVARKLPDCRLSASVHRGVYTAGERELARVAYALSIVVAQQLGKRRPSIIGQACQRRGQQVFES